MSDRAVSDTRARLLRAGERLFRTQGYAGAGLKELAQAAAAPWGSLYHFFPGGKAQLGVEVLRYAAEKYRRGLQAVFDRHPDPSEAVERIFLGEAAILENSDYRDGCPIASVTLDVASTNEELRAACAEAFDAWLSTIEQALAAAGAPPDEAADLAVFVLASLEGAIVLSRAAKSPEPLRRSARILRPLIAGHALQWLESRNAE